MLTTNSRSMIDDMMKNLTINFRKELERYQTHEHDISMDRIQYLKSTLQAMQRREQLLEDIDQTNKLLNGNYRYDIDQV